MEKTFFLKTIYLILRKNDTSISINCVTEIFA